MVNCHDDAESRVKLLSIKGAVNRFLRPCFTGGIEIPGSVFTGGGAHGSNSTRSAASGAKRSAEASGDPVFPIQRREEAAQREEAIVHFSGRESGVWQAGRRVEKRMKRDCRLDKDIEGMEKRTDPPLPLSGLQEVLDRFRDLPALQPVKRENILVGARLGKLVVHTDHLHGDRIF